MGDFRQETTAAGGFGRVLLVQDDSGEGRAAEVFAADVSGQLGAAVTTMRVTEDSARHRVGHVESVAKGGRTTTACTVGGPTAGARSRMLADLIAEAAEGSSADVIVLGLARRRMARHRLGQSLRDRVAAATAVPVLLAPRVPVPATGPSTGPGVQRAPVGAAAVKGSEEAYAGV